MHDNVIPYIPGEEQKSEMEPLKIWGSIEEDRLRMAEGPDISTTCIRIPVTDGHMAAVNVSFKHMPKKDQIIEAINGFKNPVAPLNLPSAPKKVLHFLDGEDRPQTALDRDLEKGMGISVGRLRHDSVLDFKFVALSHNTLRGGAGGAVLVAELMASQGYIAGDYSWS
jgi:aspartate-semialdehyde dehydrogenase